MEKRLVKTRLIGKEELFKVIALSEVTSLPVLLVGEPGVAKSQTLIDYASAMYGYDRQKAKDNLFILQLGDSTRGSDIAGKVDMKELLINKQYKINAPISRKEYILIDEVDKGSSAVRNNMLSLMREKALMHGDEIIRCKWKLFAGSCNEINGDASDAPFWDRFVLKHRVDRISQARIHQIWDEKDIELEIPIPSKEDINAETLTSDKMKQFIKHVYAKVSDRTATQLPTIVKAVKLIWEVGENQAIIKCCELVAPNMIAGLDKILEDPAIVAIKNKIASIPGISDIDYMGITLNEVNQAIKKLDPIGHKEEIKDITKLLKKTVSESPVCKQIMDQAKAANDAAKHMEEVIATNA
jgi:MoxR-like ATPase